MSWDRKSYMKKYHKENYKNNKDKIDSKNKEYYLNHKQEIADYKKEWYEKHKDESLKKQRDKYNPEENRKYSLKSNYNMTMDDYNNLFDSQGGRCAICGTHQSTLKKALHVDHNHLTGEIRGLLCQKCNHGIGQFNDNPDLLKRAIQYLEVPCGATGRGTKKEYKIKSVGIK